MRVAQLITRASPLGGAQVHVRELAHALAAQGHAVTVLVGGDGPFVDALRTARIPTVVLKHLDAPISPLADVRAFNEIRVALREIRPELLATHSSKAGLLGRVAGRSLGIPVVFTAHGWSFTPGVPAHAAAIYRLVERLVGSLASRIITVSEFDRRLALDAHLAAAPRIVTIHNGVADVPPQLQADAEQSPPRIVMVARFEAQKDHTTLLRAVAGLQSLPWELDLVGDGPLMRQTKELVESLGIGERVRFLGHRADVVELLAGSQLNVLISNWEGFPISILEAMRAGLPVVATDVGGVREAIAEGESGFLVPRGAVEILRDRIAQLAREPCMRVRFGTNGRTRFLREFTLETSVTRTLGVYQDALSSPELATSNRQREGRTL